MENTKSETETLLLIGGLRERANMSDGALAQFHQALGQVQKGLDALNSAIVGLEQRLSKLEAGVVTGEIIK